MTTPRRNRVDLHTHSQRSDGIKAPLELYAEMRRCGMALVALSDHDTLAGYRDLRQAGSGAEASPAGPHLIAALEINTLAWDVFARHGLGRDGEELHILGYGVDADDPVLEERLHRQRTARHGRLLATIDCLRAHGAPIDHEVPELLASPGPAGHDSLGRPHVARALIRAGHASSVDDAFARWLDHGRSCYVPREGMGPRDAIEAIREAGGLPVLAHSPEAPEHTPVINELQDWGLLGLEVHYRTFPPHTVARLEAFATERGLLATGGSDYHGDEMTYAQAQSGTWVPDSVGQRLLEALSTAHAGVR